MRVYSWDEWALPSPAEFAETHRGYGTSMHYPYCEDGGCTGCLPPISQTVAVHLVDEGPPEGIALGVTDEQRTDPVKQMWDAHERAWRGRTWPGAVRWPRVNQMGA